MGVRFLQLFNNNDNRVFASRFSKGSPPSLDPLNRPRQNVPRRHCRDSHLEATNVSRAARLMSLFGRSMRPAIGSWIRYQDPLIDCIMMHACKCFPSYKMIPNSKIKMMPGLPSEVLGVS
jgi:hypothetical protein